MKKGLKITAITVGSILVLSPLLPFAFQGKMEKIIKTEGNKMLNAQFDFEKLGISLFPATSPKRLLLSIISG